MTAIPTPLKKTLETLIVGKKYPHNLVIGKIQDSLKSNNLEGLQNDLEGPLTLEKLRDPVLLKNGQTYERSEIEKWLQKNNTDPLTRKPLSDKRLIPNTLLKNIIKTYNELYSPAQKPPLDSAVEEYSKKPSEDGFTKITSLLRKESLNPESKKLLQQTFINAFNPTLKNEMGQKHAQEFLKENSDFLCDAWKQMEQPIKILIAKENLDEAAFLTNAILTKGISQQLDVLSKKSKYIKKRRIKNLKKKYPKFAEPIQLYCDSRSLMQSKKVEQEKKQLLEQLKTKLDLVTVFTKMMLESNKTAKHLNKLYGMRKKVAKQTRISKKEAYDWLQKQFDSYKKSRRFSANYLHEKEQKILGTSRLLMPLKRKIKKKALSAFKKAREILLQSSKYNNWTFQLPPELQKPLTNWVNAYKENKPWTTIVQYQKEFDAAREQYENSLSKNNIPQIINGLSKHFTPAEMVQIKRQLQNAKVSILSDISMKTSFQHQPNYKNGFAQYQKESSTLRNKIQQKQYAANWDNPIYVLKQFERQGNIIFDNIDSSDTQKIKKFHEALSKLTRLLQEAREGDYTGPEIDWEKVKKMAGAIISNCPGLQQKFPLHYSMLNLLSEIQPEELQPQRPSMSM